MPKAWCASLPKHDVVYKQPENEEEEDACYEALELCPVYAIGDDGEE